MSTEIFRLISNETIIGKVIKVDKEKRAIFLQNPMEIQEVITEDVKYLLLRDIMKNSSETVLPINLVNIAYSYPALKEVEEYYQAVLSKAVLGREENRRMYSAMVENVNNMIAAENAMEEDDRIIQPSSNTIN